MDRRAFSPDSDAHADASASSDGAATDAIDDIADADAESSSSPDAPSPSTDARADSATQAWFRDVAPEVGLTHVQTRSWTCTPIDCDPEAPHHTGGAAVGDYDRDGDLDLYVTRFDGLDLLYQNQGDGTFVDVAPQSGAAFPLRSNGAAWGDIDNDGDLDLYVTSLGDTRFHLYVNDGTGRFTEEGFARGAAIATGSVHQGTSVAFGDYDRDGWIDLHASEWKPALPDGGLVSHARLLRNVGATAPGTFTDETSSAGVDLDGLSSLGVLAFASSFTDLDDDGWPDLIVASDFGTSRLFWNDGDGTFTDGTVAAGVGTDENGMGSALGDYDGDGRIDWFVTSIFDENASCDGGACGWGYSGNRLYRNEGGRTFSDRTDEAGVRNGFWGWGAAFFDYDNDGDQDLVMTNGVDYPEIDTDDPFNENPLRLWRNDGGVMTEVSAEVGITDEDDGKGLVVFDYDGDGDLDLFVVSHAAAPRLYRNERGNENAWLRVRLSGSSSNRDAMGARVSVRASATASPMVREIRGGSQFLGQSELVAHFGLGASSSPVSEVRIRWPRSGQETILIDVDINQTLDVVEP